MSGLEINCIRGGNWAFAMRCDNGDLLDSSLYIFKAGIVKEEFHFVNTDFSIGYKGGILSEGIYDFIIGLHGKNKIISAFICKNNSLNKNSKWDKLIEEQITVESLVPNPNHGGKKILTAVRIHKTYGDWDGDGSPDADGSKGCISIYYKDYWKFENSFELNDMGKFKLERDPDWEAGKIYG